MTIKEFLKTLTNKETKVTLIDAESEQAIVSLDAGGYDSLEDKIESRTIKKWTVLSSTAIKAILDEYVEPEPEPEPDDTDNG